MCDWGLAALLEKDEENIGDKPLSATRGQIKEFLELCEGIGREG